MGYLFWRNASTQFCCIKSPSYTGNENIEIFPRVRKILLNFIYTWLTFNVEYSNVTKKCLDTFFTLSTSYYISNLGTQLKHIIHFKFLGAENYLDKMDKIVKTIILSSTYKAL